MRPLSNLQVRVRPAPLLKYPALHPIEQVSPTVKTDPQSFTAPFSGAPFTPTLHFLEIQAPLINSNFPLHATQFPSLSQSIHPALMEEQQLEPRHDLLEHSSSIEQQLPIVDTRQLPLPGAKNLEAQAVHIRSARAVAAITSSRAQEPGPLIVPSQAVMASQSVDPSAGPNVVPAMHEVHVLSAVAVAATLRLISPPLVVLPVHAVKSVIGTQSPLAAQDKTLVHAIEGEKRRISQQKN